MKVIVNADDFGLDDHTFEWTVKGFECGALTSATIMAGMPATEKAVAYAKAHSEFSFGVHFYLVDEAPMSDPAAIPSMIDPSTGKLWPTRQFILRNFWGLVKVDDILQEMRAQYFALKDMGLEVSHVDGHGHNHRLPQSIRALTRLKEELFSVEPSRSSFRVRRCQNLSAGKMGLLGRLINGPMQRRLEKAGFRMVDYFAMNAGHSQDSKWFSNLLTAWAKQRSFVDPASDALEIGVHPGINVTWRQIDTEDCLANCKCLCKKLGLDLVTYNDI